MTDDKTKRGGSDRTRVAGGEDYEVGYLARKHVISRDQAEGLVSRVGNDREKLNAAAEKLKVKRTPGTRRSIGTSHPLRRL
jgi:ClpP class serine protease